MSGIKRKKCVVSLEKKLEALSRIDKGESVKNIAYEFGVGLATVGDWKKNRQHIEKWCSNRISGLCLRKRKTMRSAVFENVDEALYLWFVDQSNKGEHVTGPILQQKALLLYKELNGDHDEKSEGFTASTGWLDRWKKRYGINRSSSEDISGTGFHEIFLTPSVKIENELLIYDTDEMDSIVEEERLPYEVKLENDLNRTGYDAIVFVSGSKPGKDGPEIIRNTLERAYKVDHGIEIEGAVLEISLPATRLVYVPVNINKEYNDVRSFSAAGHKGISRSLKAGAKQPLVILPIYEDFSHCQLVTLLGILEALYVNLQYREDKPDVYPKIKQLGVYSNNQKNMQSVINMAVNLEIGRSVARDIGGGDPERMSPKKVEEYVISEFTNSTSLTINVIDDAKIFEKEYPLFAAVNRAASVIERHKGRILILKYEVENPEQTLFLVGKGVTYDTGGADIKAGGVMAGMSRDKCGAAAVAGFMKIVTLLKPKNIKVVGIMSMVRNSVGENSYVADEMIKARSGARIRIGNTDAEGRMIMADLLCYAKENALKSVNPHLITIATLTGHAVLTVGHGYTIVMDNGAARKANNGTLLSNCGEKIGDPIEISTIRKEDYDFHRGKVEGEDILQANNQPSVKTPRGHQGPAAFLVMASGLETHGLGSDNPIKYSHIDIAASSGDVPENPTGAPVLALFARYFSDQFSSVSDV